MKHILAGLFSLGIFSWAHGQSVHVKLVVQTRHEYCDSPILSPEVLQKIQAPRPMANVTLYLRKGNVNDPDAPILEEIKTDSAGRADFFVWEDTYLLVDARKKDRKFVDSRYRLTPNADMHSPANKACFEKWLSEPDLVIAANGSMKEITLTLTYHIPCRYSGHPCAQYGVPILE